MNIRHHIFASLLVVMLIGTSSIAVTVSADHLGVPHHITYRDAMVIMGEYEHPITVYRDTMSLTGGFEYSLPASYSNIPLHGSIWLSSEYQQPIINTLIH